DLAFSVFQKRFGLRFSGEKLSVHPGQCLSAEYFYGSVCAMALNLPSSVPGGGGFVISDHDVVSFCVVHIAVRVLVFVRSWPPFGGISWCRVLRADCRSESVLSPVP